MKPIAFVAHQPSVRPGVMGDVLSGDGIEHFTVRAWDAAIGWPHAADISALVVLGGEMNVDDLGHHPYLLRSRAMLEESIGAGIPVLGICLGAQMIARVLGAEVTAGAAREIGFHPLESSDDGDELLAPVNELKGVFQWHEDSLTLPNDAVLLHRGRAAPQSFRYRTNVYAVQFHFEVTEEILNEWCAETPDLEEGWGTTRSELMEQATEMLPDQRRAAERITRRFVSVAQTS